MLAAALVSWLSASKLRICSNVPHNNKRHFARLAHMFTTQVTYITAGPEDADVPTPANASSSVPQASAAATKDTAAVFPHADGALSLAGPSHIIEAADAASLPPYPVLPAVSTAGADTTAVGLPTTAVDEAAVASVAPATAAEVPFRTALPSPPQNTAIRPVAPRRSAAFRHSMSAMPHKSSFMQSGISHQHPQRSHLSSFSPQNHNVGQQEETDTVKSGAMRMPRVSLSWDRKSTEGVLQRPLTAGHSKVPTALQQEQIAAQRARPQTAFTATHAWPNSR